MNSYIKRKNKLLDKICEAEKKRDKAQKELESLIADLNKMYGIEKAPRK